MNSSISFESLLGQQELKQMILHKIAEKSLSHALLFTGPPGIGKKSWGYALARAILCLKSSVNGACMVCDSCLTFSTGNNPDFYLLSPEGKNIKIDQFRKIRDMFYLKSDRKVCVIDQAEKMTPETSSSLLKIIEDPPEGLFFILLAEKDSMLFPTILSRCQMYNIKPLDQGNLKRIINRLEVPAERKKLALNLSRGNPGYALAIIKDTEIGQKISEVQELVNKIATNKNSAYFVITLSADLSERDDLLSILKLLTIYFHEYLLSLYDSDIGYNKCRVYSSRIEFNLTSACVEEIIVKISKAIVDLDRTNINKRLLIDTLLLMIQRKVRFCQM